MISRDPNTTNYVVVYMIRWSAWTRLGDQVDATDYGRWGIKQRCKRKGNSERKEEILNNGAVACSDTYGLYTSSLPTRCHNQRIAF
jgi:hypothetical protein